MNAIMTATWTNPNPSSMLNNHVLQREATFDLSTSNNSAETDNKLARSQSAASSRSTSPAPFHVEQQYVEIFILCFFDLLYLPTYELEINENCK